MSSARERKNGRADTFRIHSACVILSARGFNFAVRRKKERRGALIRRAHDQRVAGYGTRSISNISPTVPAMRGPRANLRVARLKLTTA